MTTEPSKCSLHHPALACTRKPVHLLVALGDLQRDGCGARVFFYDLNCTYISATPSVRSSNSSLIDTKIHHPYRIHHCRSCRIRNSNELQPSLLRLYRPQSFLHYFSDKQNPTRREEKTRARESVTQSHNYLIFGKLGDNPGGDRSCTERINDRTYPRAATGRLPHFVTINLPSFSTSKLASFPAPSKSQYV